MHVTKGGIPTEMDSDSVGVWAGLHAMMALRAGAEHVTAVDRWLYMALACKESLVRALQPAAVLCP